MTRINADLHPAVLTDQHLFAEYREMRRIPKSLLKSLAGKSAAALIGQIPAEFRLGSGHVKFFYDKGQFLIDRYALLRRELLERAYRLNDDGVFDNLGVYRQYPAFMGSRPTLSSRDDRSLIVDRILERIRAKPHFYTLRKAPIALPDYGTLLHAALAGGI